MIEVVLRLYWPFLSGNESTERYLDNIYIYIERERDSERESERAKKSYITGFTVVRILWLLL